MGVAWSADATATKREAGAETSGNPGNGHLSGIAIVSECVDAGEVIESKHTMTVDPARPRTGKLRERYSRLTAMGTHDERYMDR